MISPEHWQNPHSPDSWGFYWTGLFPKHVWFCLKTKTNKPKNPPCCSVRASCPETWQVGWWEWLLLIRQYSHDNMFIYTHLWVSIDTDHFCIPWCHKATFWGVTWALREAEMVHLSAGCFLWADSRYWALHAKVKYHNLREGFTNQCQSESKILLQYKRKSQVILASPEPFSAADQLLSSAGQAREQEGQGAHHKFTFRVRKNPSQWLLCVLRQRKWENEASWDIIEKYIFSSCLWGVEWCFVVIGSFGFIWFVFWGSFVILKQFFIRM